MLKVKLITSVALLVAAPAFAQDAEPVDVEDSNADAVEQQTGEPVEQSGQTPDQPRSMSGMSILGNEEAPKALVIIPWKSSELGDEIGMPEHLDDKATPVDREVFLRELRFYEIRQELDD